MRQLRHKYSACMHCHPYAPFFFFFFDCGCISFPFMVCLISSSLGVARSHDVHPPCHLPAKAPRGCGLLWGPRHHGLAVARSMLPKLEMCFLSRFFYCRSFSHAITHISGREFKTASSASLLLVYPSQTQQLAITKTASTSVLLRIRLSTLFARL